MPHLYQYPPLARWDEFEMMCRDLWSIKFSKHFQLYGTRGSDQHGVDSYASIEGEYYVLQCKGKQLYPQKNLQYEDVVDTLNKVKHFPHKIKILCIATTAARRTDIQDKVSVLNAQNQEERSFEVVIYYWNEILELLSEHASVAEKYYPTLSRPQNYYRIRINDPRSNYFYLYHDEWNNSFVAISNGEDIVVRVFGENLCFDWQTRDYNGEIIFSVNKKHRYICSIELPIQMVLDAVQDYAPSDEIRQFRLWCCDRLELSTTISNIPGTPYDAQCAGIFNRKDEFWHDEDDRRVNVITSGSLDGIERASREINRIINTSLQR